MLLDQEYRSAFPFAGLSGYPIRYFEWEIWRFACATAAKADTRWNGHRDGYCNPVVQPLIDKLDVTIPDPDRTGLQLQNVGTEESEVVVVYRASDGSGPWFDGAFVRPGSSVTFFQPAHPELANGFVGSATIASKNGQPLVAIVNEVEKKVVAEIGFRLPHAVHTPFALPSGVVLICSEMDPTPVGWYAAP